MAAISAVKKNANASTEEILGTEVTDIIWHVGEPTDSPLHALLGGMLYLDGGNKPQEVSGKIKKETTDEVAYKVIEKNPLARTVKANGAVNATDTTITLDSNANLRVGDTIKNKTQEDGEFLLVYAVDSGGADISCRRNLGSTGKLVADNDQFEIVGYAATDGGAKASLKAQLAAPRTRYVQIFKRTFGITGTLSEVRLETTKVNAWDEEQVQGLVEHKKDMEFSAWFNPGTDSSTDADSNTVYFSRGIVAELAGDNTIDAGGAVSEKDFFGRICEEIFEFGPSRKAFFADTRFRSVMADWGRVKLQTTVGTDKYGFQIKVLETDHGILDVMPNGVFNKFLPESQRGFATALDLERIVRKNIKNRDTRFKDNIEAQGQDAREAEYLSEVGWSIRSLPHHKVVKNLI